MVANVSATAGAGRRRPMVITAAVWLAVGIQVISVPFFFAPGANEVPGFAIVIGIVMGLLTLVGAWGMWNLKRWGAILTLVVTFLNTLTAVPGLFAAPSGWITAGSLPSFHLGWSTWS